MNERICIKTARVIVQETSHREDAGGDLPHEEERDEEGGETQSGGQTRIQVIGRQKAVSCCWYRCVGGRA